MNTPNKLIGEVMGVAIDRSPEGHVYIGNNAVVLFDEDPVQFCDELKALLTRKPALDTLLEELTEMINEDKRVYPRTRLVAMLANYRTTRNQETGQ